jgi:hypothetical protein
MEAVTGNEPSKREGVYFMIQVLMLDLGETLVHGEIAFPHVPEALETLGNLETGSRAPLSLCLVSDFRMPTPPPTPEKIAAIFPEYLAILDRAGLRRFFEPVEQHVTLSTHAGVQKPDRRIFETALTRLGLSVTLDACLFITENEAHLAACRDLGMATLQFDGSGAGRADFQDWSEAPLLVARLLDPESHRNLELALRTHLAAAHGLEMIAMGRPSPGGSVRGRAKQWWPVPGSPQSGDETVHVPVPVDVEVQLDSRGRVNRVERRPPEPEALAEAAGLVRSLDANQQLFHGSGPLPAGATHQVETDSEGRRVVKRKRFSTI